MGNKKEEALEVIKDLRSYVEIHSYYDPPILSHIQDKLDDLRDLVSDLDVCQCSNEE